ncbi:MAG: DUF5674 family protein [Candidatus Komeilibacteria bacterium]|nr:DUF5674 family protein [Candidatus Komeilibacteria bacterium]
MKTIEEKISLTELKEMSANMFDGLVKAVVDVEKGIMAVDAEMHADLEGLLLEAGLKQQNLWGINLYPDKTGEDFIELDSMINLRPSQGNRSRGVDDLAVQQVIKEIVNKLVKK